MTKLEKVLFSVALVVVALVGVNFPVNGTSVVKEITNQVGANSGPDSYIPQFFHQGFTYGGNVNATTSAGSSILANSDFAAPVSVIKFTPNTGAAAGINVTFPASSTITGFERIGDMRSFLFVNGSSTAQSATNDPKITILGGLGVMKMSATTTAILPGKAAWIRLIRATSTAGDLDLIVEPLDY